MKKRTILTTVVAFVLLVAVIAAGVNAIFTVTYVRATFRTYTERGAAAAESLKEELNGYIKKLCEKHGCTYVDVHSCLKQEDNTMDHSCSFDGCHPNDEGYRRISAVLRPYLE